MNWIKRITLLVATSAIVMAFGFDNVNQTHKVQQEQNVAKRVSKKEFYDKLNSLDEVQLIDVRTPGEFKNGTIKGAVNYDFNSENFDALISKLDPTKPTLIFCQAGGRSAKALLKFKTLNFAYVLELEGGYSNWIR
jgi:rhodanese-related sulfurtransferase